MVLAGMSQMMLKGYRLLSKSSDSRQKNSLLFLNYLLIFLLAQVGQGLPQQSHWKCWEEWDYCFYWMLMIFWRFQWMLGQMRQMLVLVSQCLNCLIDWMNQVMKGCFQSAGRKVTRLEGCAQVVQRNFQRIQAIFRFYWQWKENLFGLYYS